MYGVLMSMGARVAVWTAVVLAALILGFMAGYVLGRRRGRTNGNTNNTPPRTVDANYVKELENQGLSPDEIFIRRLNRLLETNIENPELNVSFLCQEMYMSRTAMFNRLKALTGTNIRDYINKMRMERAVELVRDTRLNFVEISEKAGFSTARYFSTAFKSHTGFTPSEFRSRKL